MTTNFSNFNFEQPTKKIRKLIKELTNNDYLHGIFKDTEIVLSLKQPGSLLSHLTRAKFESWNSSSHTSNNQGIKKCSDKRCNICRLYLQTDSTFKLASGKMWSVRSELSCKSKNVIYFITCNMCQGKTSYIGKTNNLRLRTNGHISSCRNGTGCDKFDLHVHNCSDVVILKEPYFKLYPMLNVKNEHSLNTYESHFHKLGYDTMNH